MTMSGVLVTPRRLDSWSRVVVLCLGRVCRRAVIHPPSTSRCRPSSASPAEAFGSESHRLEVPPGKPLELRQGRFGMPELDSVQARRRRNEPVGGVAMLPWSGTTWPTTSQSRSLRMVARCSFTQPASRGRISVTVPNALPFLPFRSPPARGLAAGEAPRHKRRREKGEAPRGQPLDRRTIRGTGPRRGRGLCGCWGSGCWP